MFKIAFFGILMVMGVGYFVFPQSIAYASQPDLLKDTILVHAKVVDVKEEGGIFTGTLKITHVYCGPDKLLGDTFSAYSSTTREDNTGRMIRPALQPDEEGIWSLRIAGDKLVSSTRYMSDFQYGLSWPARERISANYLQAKATAESIELVCRAEPAQQLNMLQDYAYNQNPEISAWAIHVISLAGPEERTRLFNSLISNIDSLSISGQAALDEVLSNIDNDPWRTSEKRLALLNKWLSRDMSKDDATHVIQRLDVAAQHSEFEDKTLLKLLETAIGNRGIPPVARQDGIRIVCFIAMRAKGDGLAFEYLVRLINESDEEGFKIAAAQAIGNIGSIDSDKLPVIQSLKATTTNKMVADALEEALKRPKNQ